MEGETVTQETSVAQPETTANMKIPQEKLFLELQKTAHTLLEERGKDIKKELAGKTDEEQKQILEKDSGKRHINILYELQKARTGDYKIKESPDGMDFIKGNPVRLTIEGESRKLLYIESADDKTFMCRLEGVGELQAIPRDMVYDAQMLSEKETILGSFKGKEKELLEIYIKSLSGEQMPAEYTQGLIEAQKQIPSEDKIIKDYIETIKKEIDKLKQASQDTKKQEELLRKLTIAQKANGKGGFVFKMEAMKSLKEAGYPNMPEITEQQNTQYQESAEAIQKELQQAGVSQKDLAEIREGLAKGDLNIVVNEIVISKIKGLSTDRLEGLIFGKNMTETELENLLDPDSKMKALLEKAKKAGKGFLLILLVALFGLGSNFGKGITSER